MADAELAWITALSDLIRQWPRQDRRTQLTAELPGFDEKDVSLHIDKGRSRSSFRAWRWKRTRQGRFPSTAAKEGAGPADRRSYATISIGVPSGTASHSASISSLETAMQPSVQSPGTRPKGKALGWPWIMIIPPAERPCPAA